MAGIARAAATTGHPLPPPCVLLSGGETTVTVRGKGRGGRNVEFLLGLAVALGGAARRLGAGRRHRRHRRRRAGGRRLVTPDTLARARALGLDPRASLADNDAHPLFEALGDAVVTGPTLTNVNDFRAILVMEPAPPGAG